MTFELKSPRFDHEQPIPVRYTCEGEDLSPPYRWSDPPAGTRSLAFVVEDPDAPDPKAPKMTFVHWILVDLPPATRELPEAAGNDGPLPEGARVGKNDWGRVTWGGPCPPIGRHRYFHHLYALDTTLELEEPTRAQLDEAMNGHVLAHAELVGTYEKRQE